MAKVIFDCEKCGKTYDGYGVDIRFGKFEGTGVNLKAEYNFDVYAEVCESCKTEIHNTVLECLNREEEIET